ncbi:MAG TPA: hypothetical protein VH599_11710 [Ktedonobacterales bacterium]|jgi:hypothetical protein
MDVFDTLDALESYVRESPWVPFTRLHAVDRSVIDELLRAAREQIERAQQEAALTSSHDELLSQAANEGRLIVEAARQEAREILSDDRIKTLSLQQFDEIVGEGQQQANQLMRGAYAYTAQHMTTIERSLDKLRAQVGEGLEIARRTTRNAEKSQRQRQKEFSREKARDRHQKIKQALF